MPNTDVPESIAGFYYQMLLAARELVELIDDPNKIAVGVEKGSDIRVFSRQGNDFAIEAKFYKDNSFSKDHQTIRHTVYNFYNDFKGGNDNLYTYKTNVCIRANDKPFFDVWPQHTAEYITFIKECIIHESIRLDDVFKTRFKAFKDNNLRGLADFKDSFSYCYKKLIEHLHNNPADYNQFGAMVDDQVFMQFIDKLSFDFANQNQTKLQVIDTLKNEINAKLCKYDNTLTSQDCNKIMNIVIEEFFETTFNPNNEIVTKDMLLQHIRDYQANQLEYLNSQDIIKIVEAIEEEIERFRFMLELNYSGDKDSELVQTFLTLVEKFFEEVSLNDELAGAITDKYSLDKYGSATQITRLLSAMSVLSVFTQKDPQSTRLSGLAGINNFSFGEQDHYCLKATDSSSLNKTNTILFSFLKKTLDHIKTVTGNEIIIFDAPGLKEGFEPCKFNKDEIDELLLKTSRVDDNLKFQATFKSLDYRCTNCIQLESKDNEILEQLSRFYEEACSGNGN